MYVEYITKIFFADDESKRQRNICRLLQDIFVAYKFIQTLCQINHKQLNFIFINSQITKSNQYMFNEYNPRNDSLTSQQDFQKIQLYFTITQLQASNVYLQISIQQTNQPPKKLKQTKSQGRKSRIDFPESLVIQYFFEVRQRIIIEVINADSSYRQVLGIAQATVGQIVNGRETGVKKDIMPIGVINGKIGSIVIRSQKVQSGNSKYVQWTLVGRNVDTGSVFLCFGQAGGQWKLFKVKKNNQYLLYESEVRQGRSNRFQNFKISQKKLCNNDYKQPIIIRFCSDSGDTIGEAKTDLASLLQGKDKFTITNRGKEKGVIVFENFKQTVRHQFMDFLTNGMQMAMVLAIDFTASNGMQSAPTSLHYVTNNTRSQYEQALFQTCSIVLDYDNDKLIPCFGFGAKVNLPTFNTQGRVHHCFPLNGTQRNPNVFQLQGILDGYRGCLPYLSLAGPTFFAPLLRQAMQVCQAMKQQIKQYMILLILTDGIIHDKDEVKDLLIKCGRLPMSIIIIGIGEGEDNWRAMHELDDDNCMMTDRYGNRTERDLVQFVQFRKHNNNGVQLARQVLEELPRQVEEYHQLIKLPPEAYRKNMVHSQHQM